MLYEVIYLPFSVSGEIARLDDARQMVDDRNWAIAAISTDKGGNPVVEIIEDGLTYAEASDQLS